MKVAALADGTMTQAQIAKELGVGREYVSATLGRLGMRDMVKRVNSPAGTGLKFIAHRRLALIRRAHDAMSRCDPDGVAEAEWNQLLTDLAKEIDL